ncbi:MAG: hypothetical protein N2445_02585, partial [Acidobacteria bacterium]|nr:hypothetical protein [Acidobacteriota bacterium]
MKKIVLFLMLTLLSLTAFCQILPPPSKEIKITFDKAAITIQGSGNNYSAYLTREGNSLLIEMTIQEMSCVEGAAILKAIFQVSSSLFKGNYTFNYLYQESKSGINSVFEPRDRFVQMLNHLNSSSLYEAIPLMQGKPVRYIGSSQLWPNLFTITVSDRKAEFLTLFLSLFDLDSASLQGENLFDVLIPPCEPVYIIDAGTSVRCKGGTFKISVDNGGDCIQQEGVGGRCVSDCGYTSVSCTLGCGPTHGCAD